MQSAQVQMSPCTNFRNGIPCSLSMYSFIKYEINCFFIVAVSSNLNIDIKFEIVSPTDKFDLNFFTDGECPNIGDSGGTCELETFLGVCELLADPIFVVSLK